MRSHSRLPLIGGTGHGQSVDVDNNVKEIELDVHTTEDPNGKPKYSEKYQRRNFKGGEFGTLFECFTAESDDETESTELARWSLRQKADPGSEASLKLATISDEIGRISVRISRAVKAGELPDDKDMDRLGKLSTELDNL